MADTPSVVPVVDELFEISGSDVDLIGSRCAGCGAHYFPRTISCSNPPCSDRRVATTRLGRRGVLYSYTVQRYQPPPLFGRDPWEPYAIGLVELPEGLRVLAILDGIGTDELRIGLPLILSTITLRRDGSGLPVITYAYRPAGVADR